MANKMIQMVDLHGQYLQLQPEIEAAVAEVHATSAYINGPQVQRFATRLADYLGSPFVIPCANGTDALQIALMALGLSVGDEVIIPDFNYMAAAEATALLGLVPVLVDVDPQTFNLDARKVEQAVSPRTKAIIAVHLFGQVCDMDPLLQIAKSCRLFVIEDNAQSLGASYTDRKGITRRAGTLGHIGTTSFFPSKPLGCYGDGGAMITADSRLAERMRMIASHGQEQKYKHKMIGCNSRLDTIQAAVLEVKLNYLDEWNEGRRQVAERYDKGLSNCEGIELPGYAPYSTHIAHQYTIRVKEGRRDALREELTAKGISSMIYYPQPLHRQQALQGVVRVPGTLRVTEELCRSVLALPIYPDLPEERQNYIIQTLLEADQRG